MYGDFSLAEANTQKGQEGVWILYRPMCYDAGNSP